MYPPKKTRSEMNRRRKRRRQLLILLFLLLIAVIAVKMAWPSQTATDKPASSKKEPIQSENLSKKKAKVPQQKAKQTKTISKLPVLDNYLSSLHFSGTAIVVRNGKIILHKSYGYADREQKKANTNQTVYYIGSAQKAFIATSIMQLQEKHQLTIDDPIATYFPDFPNGKNIKIRNLLTHTSGIVGHTEGQNAITPKALVKDIEKQGILIQPGTWHYLDSNYTVLAYLVEKLSKQSLESYLKAHVFKPAGIRDAGFYKDFAKNKHASTGYYLKQDGTYMTPSLPDLSQLFGVGNMYMRPYDMYLFDKALSTKKLINADSYKEMFTKGSSSGYGFGFYVDPGSYNNHGVLNGWNVSNSFSHTGKTFVVLFSNVQNNIASFGQVNNHVYELLNASKFQ